MKKIKIIPVGAKIAVIPVDEAKESQKKSGVITPQTEKETRPCKGKVVAVGPEYEGDIKVGDEIFYNVFGPEQFVIEGITYSIGLADEFYCVIR